MRFARILCCAALAVCAFGVRAQQVMLDKVVAVVGGSSITYSEVENTALDLDQNEKKVTLSNKVNDNMVALAFKLEENKYGQLT